MTQRMCPTEVGARESSLPILGKRDARRASAGTSPSRDNGDRCTISGLLLLAIVELGRVDPLFEELAVDLGFQSVTALSRLG